MLEALFALGFVVLGIVGQILENSSKQKYDDALAGKQNHTKLLSENFAC
ncbi:hypothetical protein [Scytonema sp. HK-05]|nr:hypothetical protein [Scytonema sp. HK-05]